VAGLRQNELLAFCFPLPPLAEQKRIVAKVDELMKWCDELESLLQTQQETATRFAAAIAAS
jgi:type I restriction enzyme S subunit